MAFLPGLFSALAPMLPGIVSTIGDIAGKVINRAPGKGIGETLLEALPGALGAAGGIASSLAPSLGGTAGSVLGTVGKIAGALAPTPDYSKLGAGPSPGQSAENRAGYEKGIAPYKLGDTRENNANYELAGEKFMGPANTKEFSDWMDKNGFDSDSDIRQIPGYYNEMAQAPNPAAMRRVAAKWMQIVSDNPLTPWNEPAPASINASDYMQIRHGPATQPSHVAMAASGPLALQGVSPAQAYQNESTQSMAPRAPSGTNQFSSPPTQYSQGFSPEALVNYRGERVPIQRTQAESHGSAPSFNIFDKLAPRQPEEQRAVIETMAPANDTNDLLKQAIGLLGRREVRKVAKKQKKKAKKGRK